MACPICGANCQCKKRGPGGLCCDCHRHKPAAARVAEYASQGREWSPQLLAALEKHKEWVMAAENVKTWGEAVSKKQDLRNKGESTKWKPHNWSQNKASEFTRHFFLVLLAEFEREMGPHKARLQLAEFKAAQASRVSAAILAAAGVQTVGA